MGRAVKVISFLLPHLPSQYRYNIIFLHRDLDEILASQDRMLLRSGAEIEDGINERLSVSYRKHIQEVTKWINSQPNIQSLYLHYRRIVQDPLPHALETARFLDLPLDVSQMAQVCQNTLYRNRSR